jgi:hypothetical protein
MNEKRQSLIINLWDSGTPKILTCLMMVFAVIYEI